MALTSVHPGQHHRAPGDRREGMVAAGIVGHGLPPVPCPRCRTNISVTLYRGPHGDPDLPEGIEHELGWCDAHGEIHSRLVYPNGRTFLSGRADIRS